MVYVKIGKTQYAHVLLLQIKVPLPVIFILRPLIVPTPVQFDHKAGGWTKKSPQYMGQWAVVAENVQGVWIKS